MPIGQFQFSYFAVVGMIMLVLAGTSFGYLLLIKNKSGSTRMLLRFLLCVVLSSVATILTNSGTPWAWAFAPSQDALLILSSVFLVRFAYSYPSNDQQHEARRVTTAFAVPALIAVSYAAFFALLYIFSLPTELSEEQAYYLLTPLTIMGVVLVFFRRSLYCSSRPADLPVESVGPKTSPIKALLRPQNQAATTLRGYGLAVAVSLVPVVSTITRGILPAIFTDFIFNFGVVIAIASVMLIYLNHAPEPVTISSKLVGLSLVSTLLILGLASVLFYLGIPGPQTSNWVVMFVFLILFSSLLIIGLFPIFFRYMLLRPLDQLLKAVRTANGGDLTVQIPVQYEDEIGFLTRSFNNMVGSLNNATQALKNESINLEKQVAERTRQLSTSNEQLVREIGERKNAEATLDRQLRFQQALAGFSQSLLVVAESESMQQEVLTTALEHLRSGTEASRAYVHRRIHDPKLGWCFQAFAETCAPGISPHITNPANRMFPASLFPELMCNTLDAGEPFGGPVDTLFASTPSLRDAFLNQRQPLLSVQIFPIHTGGEWWGFIGFDGCYTVREWTEWDIVLLDTSSEIVGNTLQRWEAETRLRETLDKLETLVEERTADLRRLNATLVEEVRSRERLNSDMEKRLRIEQQLAAISTRLQDIADPRASMKSTLADLGTIMGAGRTFLIEYEPAEPMSARDLYEWHRPDLPPLTSDLLQDKVVPGSLWDRLREGSSVFVENTGQPDEEARPETRAVQAHDGRSLLLTPLVSEKSLRGVLGCSLDAPLAAERNLRVFEVVAGIMSNVLQREYLIETLEEQVAERSQQLTTFLNIAMLSEEAHELAGSLQPALAAITEISDCDACTIHIIDGSQSGLQLVAQRGVPPDLARSLHTVEMDATLKDWLQIGDQYHAPVGDRGGPVLSEPLDFPGCQTSLTVRLRARGISQGLLTCYRTSPQPFSPFQKTIVTALGDLLGVIVENHRLRVEAEGLAAIEERQRLAREIHDAISQSVYSLSLFARSAKDALDEGNEGKLLANLDDLEATSLQAMKEMRLLLYQLREAGSGDIPSALEARFNQVERRLGMLATYEISGDLAIPDDIQHEVWRIVIEALNNTVKHANATAVRVQCCLVDEQLVVSVQDDGAGFDGTGDFPGMGLRNMRSRAERLGGHLCIVSAPAKGTQVRLEIPVKVLDVE